MEWKASALELLIVGVGGFVGSVARYVVSGIVDRRCGETFPAGTLVVNVAGCLAIGVLMHLVAERPEFSPRLRLLIGAGFLGAFTTFSTFGFETLETYKHHGLAPAIINVVASIVFGLLAVLAGRALARLF